MAQPVEPPPLVLLSGSEAQTRAFGAAFARAWVAGAAESLAVVSLAGVLGTGKTQFAKGVVAGLGGDADEVTSPTFTLLDIHATPQAEVHHLDCYRLDDPTLAFDVGLEASLEQPAEPGKRKLILIEWASRVEALLPQGAELRQIEFAHESPDRRRLVCRGLTQAERTEMREVAGDPLE